MKCPLCGQETSGTVMTSWTCWPEDLKHFKEWVEIDLKFAESYTELLSAWQAAFPDRDILAQMRQAYSWWLGAPRSRRPRCIARFLNNWLKRPQWNSKKTVDQPIALDKDLKEWWSGQQTGGVRV